jgi:hypothetical protein
MADVITRFKLETTQYDSKLRDTVKGLKDVIHLHELAGKDFKEFSESQVQAARSLGQMATSATNAKDKVKELVSSYNDMSRTYNEMSETMKKSEGGKALASSLEQLQKRIKDAKAEMNATPGILDKMASKLTINVDALKLFNVGLQAAKGALSVAKDAFFASEETVDEWGRTIDASKSLYEGFLTALNTGDISGYISRINDIVAAARAAYNELDRLGTMKSIQAPQMSAQQTENERMRMMIQTGRYIAPIDGRGNAVYNGRVMQNGDLLSPAQIQSIERQLQGGMQKVITLVSNEVRQSTKAINAVYDRQAKELGLSLKEFRAGTSSMAEFDKRIAGYQQYQTWRAQHTTIDQQSGREIVARGNPYQEYAKWGVFRVDGDRYNQLVQLIQQRDQQMVQAYGMQSQNYRAINRVEGITIRKLMGGDGGGGGTGGGFDVSKIAFKAGEGFKADPDRYFQSVWSMMNDKGMRDMLGIPGKQFDLGKDISEKDLRKLLGLRKDEDDHTKEIADRIGSVVSGVGNIFSGIQNLGVEIPDGLAKTIGAIQTMTGILTSILALVTLIKGEQTVQTTTGIIDAIVPFARGGVVRAANGYVSGNTYSGDQIPAMLNAGEVVLNRSQVSTLAAQFSGSGDRALNLRGVLRGSNILLCLENTLQEQGKGELVTFKG